MTFLHPNTLEQTVPLFHSVGLESINKWERRRKDASMDGTVGGGWRRCLREKVDRDFTQIYIILCFSYNIPWFFVKFLNGFACI